MILSPGRIFTERPKRKKKKKKKRKKKERNRTRKPRSINLIVHTLFCDTLRIAICQRNPPYTRFAIDRYGVSLWIPHYRRRGENRAASYRIISADNENSEREALHRESKNHFPHNRF
ncbi:hypothetical protein PUN28_008641 [Cardiocondyla obscurior]|uniref:Uncharacterized protein n=1 Tax=Cardiocondyla obscurior TaxID=286306 RepID=A0AAW2FYJ1_9HYME